MAEGGGLLNRYTIVKLYRGFESPFLRHPLSLILQNAKFSYSAISGVVAKRMPRCSERSEQKRAS